MGLSNPVLASQMPMSTKIPNQNNLYGTIFVADSQKMVADFFVANGWNVRKSTWTDYEAKNSWAELTIESDGKNPLVNGAIDPAMFDDLKQCLDLMNAGYSLELYDNDGVLLRRENK